MIVMKSIDLIYVLLGPPSNGFLLLISWMVTLSSCLIWQIISFILPPKGYDCVYAWTTLGNIATLLLPILAKKIIFSDEVHFDLGGYVNKKNCGIWGIENPNAYIEKPIYPKRLTVWWGFWSKGIIGTFFIENEQGEAVIVTGDRYRDMLNEFLFTKIEEEDIGNIRFQKDGATATQPNLHSMFCALFLKIALSAAELTSFGHLGTAIWHRWTIICWVPSKISVTSTSQRQLTL